jgi:hypothetical protein
MHGQVMPFAKLHSKFVTIIAFVDLEPPSAMPVANVDVHN